jgi:hypothetical protein
MSVEEGRERRDQQQWNWCSWAAPLALQDPTHGALQPTDNALCLGLLGVWPLSVLGVHNATALCDFTGRRQLRAKLPGIRTFFQLVMITPPHHLILSHSQPSHVLHTRLPAHRPTRGSWRLEADSDFGPLSWS